jgi:cytochrome P450
MTGGPACQRLIVPQFVSPDSDDGQAAIQRDYLEFLKDVADQCGKIGCYSRRGAPVVLVNAPELAHAMLVGSCGDLTKGDFQHTAFRALLGNSISLGEGERHGLLRRLLAPLFARQRMARHAATVVQTAEQFCARWTEFDDVDLFRELHRLTVSTLGRALIAEPPLWDEAGQFFHARERLWHWITGIAEQHRNLVERADQTVDADVNAAIGVLRSSVDETIRARRPGDDRGDVLGDLLRANRNAGFELTPEEVKDQILALLFAAHETSAAALFWSIYLLAEHLWALHRTEQEIRIVLAGRAPTLADLVNLPYTLQVVREAMRLYPPAGRQFRVARRDTVLKEFTLPAGTPVTLCHYTLHRRAESFPEPDRFDPDRFAIHETARHPLAYLPFGAGRRLCLGRHYAIMEVHLLLALLIARFRFAFDGRVRAYLGVTLRPRGEARVKVRAQRYAGKTAR